MPLRAPAPLALLISGPSTMTLRIGRRAYAEMFGPTTGDRVRLADTDLSSKSSATSPPTATKSNSAAAR